MRNRDSNDGHGLPRQLQLIETEAEERRIVPPMSPLRRRISRTPLRVLIRLRHDAEVTIRPALDRAPVERAPIGERPEVAGSVADRALFDRLANICARIADGDYNCPAVLNVVARRIVESGEIGEGNSDC